MSTAKPSSSIMDRIRKCLNLSDITKGATEAEAAAAMAAAKRLMAEHNLNISDIEMKEEVRHGANSTADTLTRKNRYDWENYVARVADALFGTKHYFTSLPASKGGGWVRRVMFVGVGQDSAIASEAYSILVDIVFKMGAASGYEGRQRTSYCLGVVQTLIERANDSVRDITPVQEEKCRGIMVVKNQVIETHLKQLGLRNARASRRSVNGAAYNHGKADGRNVNLSFNKALR